MDPHETIESLLAQMDAADSPEEVARLEGWIGTALKDAAVQTKKRKQQRLVQLKPPTSNVDLRRIEMLSTYAGYLRVLQLRIRQDLGALCVSHDDPIAAKRVANIHKRRAVRVFKKACIRDNVHPMHAIPAHVDADAFNVVVHLLATPVDDPDDDPVDDTTPDPVKKT